jgi:hypothetical protein
LLVGGAAFVAYARTLLFGFVYDDTTVIRFNPQLQSWPAVAHALTQPYWGANGAASGLYRPLFVSVLGVLWNATNRAPIWFHLLAVGLHVVASIAVWRLARRAVGNWPAAIGALWFAVQPVHVEAIASVANSSEIMVALCAMLVASSFGRAIDESRTTVGWSSAIVPGVWFAAACSIKESGVMLPALAFSYALWWRRPETRVTTSLTRELRRWWRVIVVLAVVLALTFAVRVAVLGSLVPATIAAPGLAELTFGQRVWAMLALGPVALRVIAVPRMLNPHYGPSYLTGSTGPTLAAVLTIASLVIAIAFATAKLRRGDGRFAAGIAWFLLAFLPASNLLAATGQIFAERTLYVSTVGSALIAAWIADRIAELARRAPSARLIRSAAGGLAVITLLMALERTLIASTAWRTHTALFRQMIAADSRSYRGYWLVGLDERSRDQADSALVNLSRAYSLYAKDRQLLIDYAETLRSRGRHREAALIAAELMQWPDLRRNPDAVNLYLGELSLGFGPDSVRAARRRLAR